MRAGERGGLDDDLHRRIPAQGPPLTPGGGERGKGDAETPTGRTRRAHGPKPLRPEAPPAACEEGVVLRRGYVHKHPVREARAFRSANTHTATGASCSVPPCGHRGAVA